MFVEVSEIVHSSRSARTVRDEIVVECSVPASVELTWRRERMSGRVTTRTRVSHAVFYAPGVVSGIQYILGVR